MNKKCDCTWIDNYLNRQLNKNLSLQFNDHLKNCPNCQGELKKWTRCSLYLKEHISQLSSTTHNQSRTKLLQATKTNTLKTNPYKWAIPAFAICSMFVLLGGILFYLNKKQPHDSAAISQSYEVIFPESKASFHEIKPGSIITTNTETKVLRLGSILAGLEDSTKIKVKKSTEKITQLTLLSGVVAFDISPGSQRKLEIFADDWTIKVVGTVFWVDLKPGIDIQVGVLDGTVTITEDNDDSTVTVLSKMSKKTKESSRISSISKAEETHIKSILYPDSKTQSEVDTANDSTLSSPAKHETHETHETQESKKTKTEDQNLTDFEPKRKQLSSISEIEKIIIHGDYSEAINEINARLKSNPRDTQALDLLAIWNRKQGKYESAAKVYSQIIELNSKMTITNRARFRLAIIYQDHLNHPEKAISVLKDYISAPQIARPNSAEAHLRLAACYKRIKNITDYKQTLRRLIATHPGTREAQTAGELLRHN